MTEPDRKLVLDALTESRDALAAALKDARGERVSQGWTALQIAEHITMSEQGILKLIMERIAGMPPNPRTREKIKWSDEEVLGRVSVPGTKAIAPEFLQPTGRFHSIDEASAAFAQARTLTIEYAASTKDELRERVFPHPGLGPLDGVQWLLIQAAHASRHAHQLKGLIVGDQTNA